VRNRDEAEDVAQRVIIEMIRGIAKLREPYAFRGWLQRIITNACYRQDLQLRTDLKFGDLLEEAETIADDRLEARPEDYTVAADMREYIGGYLGQLPPSQALMLTLRYTEELSYKEIAQVLEVSIGTVSSTMSKAKKNLKTLLKDKRDSVSLGIIFGGSFFANKVKDTVLADVDSTVSTESVENLIAFGKLSIVGSTAGAKLLVATGSTAKITVSIAVAVALLSGMGVTAYELLNNNITEGELAPVVEQPAGPNSLITYSVPVEQTIDDATNPSDIKLQISSGEVIRNWILTDSNSGNPLLSGKGEFIEVAALGLPEGDYTVTWYVVNADGIESRIFFDFFMRY
jgi:RNA polymerase sigma factor (sigma-70 family)